MRSAHAAVAKLLCLQAPLKRRGRPTKAAAAPASAAEAGARNSAPAPSAPAAEQPARKRGRPSKSGVAYCIASVPSAETTCSPLYGFIQAHTWAQYGLSPHKQR